MRSRSLGQEKAHHHTRGVEADGSRIAAARIAAEPSVRAIVPRPAGRRRPSAYSARFDGIAICANAGSKKKRTMTREASRPTACV
jgi:hypothetical protein